MILVAIGSNLKSESYGMPLENCLNVINFLNKLFYVTKISHFYESEPIPKSEQPWYVNGVVEIKTTLRPRDIIEKLFLIENEFGRVRKKKNEARIIDLDLLCYKKKIINKKNLIIPHPRLHLRKFVVKPICDISPEWIHPILNKKSKDLLKNVANQKIFYIKR